MCGRADRDGFPDVFFSVAELLALTPRHRRSIKMHRRNWSPVVSLVSISDFGKGDPLGDSKSAAVDFS